jgi:adenylate cyclase
MTISLLVVDDVEDNRVALRMRLALAGYEDISEAENGRKALEMLRAGGFDLVLLDIMMPEMDGYAVLSEMKSDTQLRDIPVIMISALDEMSSVVRCIELGAADYLAKPFNPTLLKARVDNCNEKIELRNQERRYFENIETEKKKSDNLLATLLPRQVVRVLKSNRKLPPVHYDDVSILFCDIAGFTEYSENNPPEIVFSQLESLVDEFETIADEFGLMKVKTIGDAVLMAGGLLDDLDTPVRSAVACGQAMIDASRRHEAGWHLRIGIDHGPVVAGVIGRTRYQFDVWGDTVNTASRIQEFAALDTVTLSGRAWHQLRDASRGRSLGIVELKGKRSIEVVECLELRHPPRDLRQFSIGPGRQPN